MTNDVRVMDYNRIKMAAYSALILLNVFSGVAAVAIKGRLRGAARVMATISILSFIGYNIVIPSSMNIRVDLFITIPVSIISIAVLITASRHGKAKE